MISNLKSREENKEYLKSTIGAKGGQIDWMNSIGKEFEYEYNWNEECAKGSLKIVRYTSKNRKGYLYFEGYEKEIKTDSIIRCELGSMLGIISSEFKYEIGDTMNYLTIINRKHKKDDKYSQNKKYYKYKCNKCGHEDWIVESNLKKGNGCNVCSGQKAVLGINTIWDIARWMIDLGVSIEDAKKYRPGSGKKIEVKCPDCGKIKKNRISDIYNRHSIGCSCGDGISYPEKLMESVLIQLNIKYERQYKTDWSQNKVYDFYLLDYNAIIETHGLQHYKKSGRGRSLKEEQENDKLKEELALKNGIKYYIIIDSSKSDLEYIKNNILDSELGKLFDLDKVDWIKCGGYALKNKVKEVCEYYKKHPKMTTTNLAEEFSMSDVAIRKYLKQGTNLGWCEYNAKEEMRRSGRLAGEHNSKPVLQFSLDGKFIKKYTSISKAQKETGINNIYACCLGKRKKAGGYVWKYAE